MPELSVSLHESDIRRLASELEAHDPPQPRRDDFAALLQQAAVRWCRENPPEPPPRHDYAGSTGSTDNVYVISGTELRLGDWIAGQQVVAIRKQNKRVYYDLEGDEHRGKTYEVPVNGLVAIGRVSTL